MDQSSIKIGDANHIGSVVIAESIESSFNALKESQADNKTQVLLTQLLNEIKALNAKVPDSQEMQDLSDDAQALVKESQRESPRKDRYRQSLEGIQAAGKVIGTTADTVVKVVKALGLIIAL